MYIMSIKSLYLQFLKILNLIKVYNKVTMERMLRRIISLSCYIAFLVTPSRYENLISSRGLFFACWMPYLYLISMVQTLYPEILFSHGIILFILLFIGPPFTAFALTYKSYSNTSHMNLSLIQKVSAIIYHATAIIWTIVSFL